MSASAQDGASTPTPITGTAQISGRISGRIPGRDSGRFAPDPGNGPGNDDELARALRARGASEDIVIDGRRRRTERGRMAVIEATIAMIEEGTTPTFGALAARVGLSERTLFRYFPDRDALLGAAALEIYPTFRPCLTLETPSGDLTSRVERLVRLRLELIDRSAPFARIIDRLAPHSPLAAALAELRTERLQIQTVTWLSEELADRRASIEAMVEMVLSPPAIARLRESLDDDAIVDALVETVHRLLA